MGNSKQNRSPTPESPPWNEQQLKPLVRGGGGVLNYIYRLNLRPNSTYDDTKVNEGNKTELHLEVFNTFSPPTCYSTQLSIL